MVLLKILRLFFIIIYWILALTGGSALFIFMINFRFNMIDTIQIIGLCVVLSVMFAWEYRDVDLLK